MIDYISGSVGRKAYSAVNYILNLCAFSYRILKALFRGGENGRAIIRRAIIDQIYYTAVQALQIMIPISLLVGSIMILQFAKITGQYDLGKTAVLIIVRESGPIITAFVVILRSATAVTVETSYMNIRNEIESIEMLGIDPVRIICVPRLIGITSAIVCLFIVFDLLSIIGGAVIVWSITNVPVEVFLGQVGKAITVIDILVGIIKALAYGFIITVVCTYHGFVEKSRITQLAETVSRASIECFFYCIVIDIIVSAVFYL